MVTSRPNQKSLMFNLSLSLYDTPGLAPHMNVLFWRPDNFPINRDTSWNTWNRHSGSIMVDTRILFCNMKSPFHELTLDQSRWLPNRSDFSPISLMDTELDLHRITNGFIRAFATDVACQQGMLTLQNTWFPPFLGFAYAPIVGATVSELASSFHNIPRYFLDFALYNVRCLMQFDWPIKYKKRSQGIKQYHCLFSIYWQCDVMTQM